MTAITREYLDALKCDRQATEDAVPHLVAALRRVLDLCDDDTYPVVGPYDGMVPRGWIRTALDGNPSSTTRAT